MLTLRQQQKRRERQNVTAFLALLKTPGASGAVLPASGTFALVSRAGTAAITAATFTGTRTHTVGVPALVAGAPHLIGKLEIGTVVTLVSGFDLYLDTGLGTYRKVLHGA